MTTFARRRARFNRLLTNRLVRPISGWVPDWSIVEHVATNGGQVKLSGTTFRVTQPMIVPTADAVETVKPPWGKMMKAMGIRSTLLLTRAR